MVDVSRRREAGEERTYTMSMSSDLYDEVQRLAAENERSMNLQLRWYVKEGVARDLARQKATAA